MHISVLLEESIKYLNLKENSVVADCTLGYAGHSSNILRIIKNKKRQRCTMNEIIKQFKDKECLVYTMSSQVSGVITAVCDNWIEIDSGKEKSVVNIDYIMRIREYPKNKSGKKKSVVLD